MKKNKIIYWTATILMLLSGVSTAPMYFTNPMFIESFHHLGFPDYFRIELGVFKIIGAIVLLLPMIPAKFKEWSYVGFAIAFISAFIAHSVVDSFPASIFPLIPLAFLVVSYIYFHKNLATK
ncbi:DoxX family protein [Pedobacter chinensis]|uniref:DoxX family protein n=1 Tax=Pedobacter chinensis TaxID=2282421 RepID=A0A369PV83_9SPHI|nr:DoxX family protein [Pedobacter chinensis]RDC56561.1 DoxX family protein [Pedobacter chinensis]